MNDLDNINNAVALREQVKPVLLFRMIADWAEDRNLIKGSDSFRQLAKLAEEQGELAGGVCRGNRAVILDSIGDMGVVLTILAEQQQTTIEECMIRAWNDIKDRKGRMVDGVFIKEGDLTNG